ncbi:MAG: hypothetical protein E6G90_00635 [Alphaproteobacteria bacterium]|nr:MAG: hypothetical protein E6G90_00635 [Alphaproteobacteria bacterium]
MLQQFGAEATRLPRALDFGDSYVDVVLPSQVVGGVPMVVFFQMDKATHGLKRIQLERPRHGVNPPAFRAILAALRSDFGTPDQMCVVPARPAGGYQAAAEELWVRHGAVVSATRHDSRSLRRLPIRSRQRDVRADRSAIGADRPARG